MIRPSFNLNEADSAIRKRLAQLRKRSVDTLSLSTQMDHWIDALTNPVPEQDAPDSSSSE